MSYIKCLVQNGYKGRAYQIVALGGGSVIIIIGFQIRRKVKEVVPGTGK